MLLTPDGGKLYGGVQIFGGVGGCLRVDMGVDNSLAVAIVSSVHYITCKPAWQHNICPYVMDDRLCFPYGNMRFSGGWNPPNKNLMTDQYAIKHI